MALNTPVELSVARQSPNEPLTLADRRFLNALSNHISMAAHAALLFAELERSRLTIVAAEEESRRYLGVGIQPYSLPSWKWRSTTMGLDCRSIERVVWDYSRCRDGQGKRTGIR